MYILHCAVKGLALALETRSDWIPRRALAPKTETANDTGTVVRFNILNSPLAYGHISLSCRALAPCALELVLWMRSGAHSAAKLGLGRLETLILLLARCCSLLPGRWANFVNIDYECCERETPALWE